MWVNPPLPGGDKPATGRIGNRPSIHPESAR
jgi:hypothetical protein